jgi:HPt (histidine-containing phosphotransfer) domain-containing protein
MTVSREAHTMKSSAANIGAMRMNGLAAELERRTRSGSLAEIDELPEKLGAAYVRVCEALRERMAG